MRILSLKTSQTRLSAWVLACLLVCAGVRVGAAQSADLQTLSPTLVNVTGTVKQASVKRLGINLSGQAYWDSSQIMRNLAFRNPGFEGESWQSILHCASVTSTSCTDDNTYSAWPTDFFKSAQAEFIYGNNDGQTVTVTGSTAVVNGVSGVTVSFAALPTPPAQGDYLVVRKSIPGNAQAGWWTYASGGGSFATEFSDLSPASPGKQALRINASGANQSAVVSSFFDTTAGHSFIQLKGSYTLTFRAKAAGGSNQLGVALKRVAQSGGNTEFFTQTVALTNNWQDYSYTFNATETGVSGILSLSFSVGQSSALLDDVSLTAAPSSVNNPTAFRDEVVSTLTTLRPGILRYMDSGTNWGSSLDNMLQPAFARVRPGYSNWGTESDDVPLGLHEFLVLCQTVGTEPWYTMQAGMSKQEMSDLMDYLGGSTATVYGARRAALGQVAPWTSVFPTIHLEFGNEVWNTANPGATMTDPVAYGKRAGEIFATARASAAYSPNQFDLVLDGWSSLTWWCQQVLAASSGYDTIDGAPYLFNTFNDDSSTEAIFGSMFAQPEQVDSTANGYMYLEAQAAAQAAHPAKVAVYESNLSTLAGSVSQSSVSAAVPSLGAGLVSIEHMLLMMRDLGIVNQNMFSLGGYQAQYSNTSSAASGGTPLWGGVVDMGNTNRLRPTLMAEQLANGAILPSMLLTIQSGANPTWDQPLSQNDSIALTGAHEIQTFAFTDGNVNKVILFNLSRTQARPVAFSGSNAPMGDVSIQTLTSANVMDSNENDATVGIANSSATMVAGVPISLPPFSMTVISSAASSSTVTGVSVSCTQSTINISASTSCTPNVTGMGAFSSDLSWTASAGTITPAGVYTAPVIAPPSGVATITATSLQDATKSATMTISITTPNTVTAVTAACTPNAVTINANASCTAKVTGTGNFSSAVTWSADAGTISPNGAYLAPQTVPASGMANLTATSTQDPTKSTTVSITIAAETKVTTFSIACTPSSVEPGTLVYCTANVTGTGSFSSGVNWTSSAGTIWTTGVFVVPDVNVGTITITGVSTQDSTKSATTTLTLPNANIVKSVSIGCNPAHLDAGATTACTANVTGSGGFSSAVTWSASVGTISPAGGYSAPATAPASGYATITAVSTQDPSKSAAISVAITTPSIVNSVTVACLPTSMMTGGVSSCTATISGTGSFSSAVTWSAAAGAITPAGIYTAPAVAPASGFDTITAISTQDSTKFASTTIAITTPATIKSVSVACSPTAVLPGSLSPCTASATGTGSFSSSVTWSASAGTISAAGFYTAPPVAPASGVATITATSTQDVTKMASTTVAITSPPAINSITVNCNPSSVAPGDLVICTANVAGNGAFSSRVNWSASVGTIWTTGVFVIPTTASGSVTVTAVSAQDATKSASTTITVVPVPAVNAVSVTCAPTNVAANAGAICSASVTGTGSYNPAVTWSTSAGTIDQTGKLIAPSDVSSVTVVATSKQTPTVFGSAAVTIIGVPKITAVTVSGLTPTTATISWNTGTPTYSGVNSGTTRAYGTTTTWVNTMTANPTFTLTGLKPGTVYYLMMFSINSVTTVTSTIEITTPMANQAGLANGSQHSRGIISGLR